MKKALLAILAIIYITTSVGATVHVHYCMGKLASWGLGHEAADKCGKCGMEKKPDKSNGCCHDQNKFFQNNADQKTATQSAITFFQQVAVIIPASFIEMPACHISSVAIAIPNSNAPPRYSGTAAYIYHCVFRL